MQVQSQYCILCVCVHLYRNPSTVAYCTVDIALYMSPYLDCIHIYTITVQQIIQIYPAWNDIPSQNINN